MAETSKKMPTYRLHNLRSVPATDYATAWSSPWTDSEHGVLSDVDLQLLAHVNCSYLSSGRPPTLLALKQHAQALTNLIRKLTVSSTFGIVGGGDDFEDKKFEENEAFDWLNTLDVPYANDDPSHHLPLWAIANQVEAEDDFGIETHCPLKKIRAGDDKTGKRQYATHQNLVMHANDCLEILDHEYSATGGLMSILPTQQEGDRKELEGARNSFLGQWLLHHQHLVARLHELEINYANALDMVAGMRFQPGHIDSRVDKHLRTNPQPQQRFVLVNAGEDVFNKVHDMMDKAEGLIERKQAIWWESGVTGEKTWEEQDGRFYTRGMVPMDLVTRFFRVKGKGRGTTIYMLPAVQAHPSAGYTRGIEYPPKIVSVVAPKWTDRMTSYEEMMEEGKAANEEAKEGGAASKEVAELRDMLAAQNAELKQTTKALRFYESRVNQDDKIKMKELLHVVGEYEDKLKRVEEVFPEEYRSCFETTGLVSPQCP